MPKQDLQLQQQMLQYILYTTIGYQQIAHFHDSEYEHLLADKSYLYKLKTKDNQHYEIRLFQFESYKQNEYKNEKRETSMMKRKSMMEEIKIMSWYYWFVSSNQKSLVNEMYQMRETQEDLIVDVQLSKNEPLMEVIVEQHVEFNKGLQMQYTRQEGVFSNQQLMPYLWFNQFLLLQKTLIQQDQPAIKGYGLLQVDPLSGQLVGAFHEDSHIFQEAQDVNAIRNLILNHYEFITQSVTVTMNSSQKQSYYFNKDKNICRLKSVMNFIFNSQEFRFLRSASLRRIVPYNLSQFNLRASLSSNKVDSTDNIIPTPVNNTNNNKSYRDLKRDWDRFFQKHPLDSIQMTYVRPQVKSKYYIMANILYLFEVELQMNEVYFQKMQYDSKLMESLKEGFRAAYRQNFSIDEEDLQSLESLMAEQENTDGKAKRRLDLVQVELFLLCLENIRLLVTQVQSTKSALERHIQNQSGHTSMLFSSQNNPNDAFNFRAISEDKTKRLKAKIKSERDSLEFLFNFLMKMDLFSNPIEKQKEIDNQDQSQIRQEWKPESDYFISISENLFMREQKEKEEEKQKDTPFENDFYIRGYNCQQEQELQENTKEMKEAVFYKDWDNDKIQSKWIQREPLKVQYLRPVQPQPPQGCFVQQVHTKAQDKLDQAILDEIQRFNALNKPNQ